MDGLEIVRGLIARGYSPHQAAALAGHMLQESGGNPSNVNPSEGAHGLMQWRLDRWDNLQNFAKSQGKSPNDPNVQLDFVRNELEGPEKKAGAGFLAAPDVASASAALKPYIRFGDNSAGTRLANAQGLFSQLQGGGPVGALASGPASGGAAVEVGGTPAAAPPPDAGGMVTAAGPAAAGAEAPVGALASAGSLGGGMEKLGKQLAGQQPDFLPDQQIQMARPNMGQAQQIAAALAKSYGFGG